MQIFFGKTGDRTADLQGWRTTPPPPQPQPPLSVSKPSCHCWWSGLLRPLITNCYSSERSTSLHILHKQRGFLLPWAALSSLLSAAHRSRWLCRSSSHVLVFAREMFLSNLFFWEEMLSFHVADKAIVLIELSELALLLEQYVRLL